MSDSQFCSLCPTDMPKHRQTGRWAKVEDHEHELPMLRPDVYLYDATPGAHIWSASLDVWQGTGWLGNREFLTQNEAMDYATKVLVPLAKSRWKVAA